MSLQIIMMLILLSAFALLGFMLSRSIKSYEAKPKGKKKKGRTRYMPQAKNPGK